MARRKIQKRKVPRKQQLLDCLSGVRTRTDLEIELVVKLVRMETKYKEKLKKLREKLKT